MEIFSFTAFNLWVQILQNLYVDIFKDESRSTCLKLCYVPKIKIKKKKTLEWWHEILSLKIHYSYITDSNI